MIAESLKVIKFGMRPATKSVKQERSSQCTKCALTKSYSLLPPSQILVMLFLCISVQFSSVQSLSHVRLFATSWIVAHQASLSITNSRSSPKFMCIESVMPTNHLILCHPLLLLPPIPPSIRVFSNESALLMRWPQYWSFSFSISPSNEHPGLISFRMDWLDLLAVQDTVPNYHECSLTSSFKLIQLCDSPLCGAKEEIFLMSLS